MDTVLSNSIFLLLIYLIPLVYIYNDDPYALRFQLGDVVESAPSYRSAPYRVGSMAFTTKQMSMIVATFGTLSFILGVIAENKKPAAGTPIEGKGVTICKYPYDPTVVLGYLSAVFLVASTVAGYLSLFYPYKGKSIPQSALFRSTSFLVFFNIALGTAGLAAAFLLWPTITEQLHLTRNVHYSQTECPTAKTGLLGGGAFLSLDSSLFWLVALMLADNAREDYFEEVEGGKGDVLASDYDNAAVKQTA